MISMAIMWDAKFSLPDYMQLYGTVQKLFHFRREIVYAKVLRFDLDNQSPRG